MGVDIARVDFTNDDLRRFRARLRDELRALGEVLGRPGFGEGETTIGAELELSLIDADARPEPRNDEVLRACGDPRIAVEINAFNLEINAPPCAIAGASLSALAGELDDALGTIASAAARCGARPITIGILPTIEEVHLRPQAMTQRARYHALSEAIRRRREGPFQVRIAGDDELSVLAEDVTFEGANTSFQVHLRVPPRRFAAAFNAAMIATGPLLAAACNAPLFLGRRLWSETRVALFRQATDDRRDALVDDWHPARVSFGHGFVREGAHELFAESVALHAPLLPVVEDDDPIACARRGGVPKLSALRLHHGTIWHWNRAIYDHLGGGHLRIELRALPSGPSVVDMVANAAFSLGLVLGLAPRVDALLPGFLFGHARRNFYRAARFGLDAELLWPTREGEVVRAHRAPTLVRRLLPIAREGLASAGVDRGEAGRWLDVIAARVDRGITGAAWQRRTLDALGGARRRGALAELVERYLAGSASGKPVHEWPVP